MPRAEIRTFPSEYSELQPVVMKVVLVLMVTVDAVWSAAQPESYYYTYDNAGQPSAATARGAFTYNYAERTASQDGGWGRSPKPPRKVVKVRAGTSLSAAG